MSTGCKHCLEDSDENLLLDDENIQVKKCLRCRKQTDLWSNGALVDALNINGDGIHVIDDHVDVPEDSPLLINNLYREPMDEFHCHDSLSTTEDTKAWKKLLSASLFCFLFMITELIGGYFAGSLAAMTDAAHLFSDFIGFLISLLAIWVSRKPATRIMTFGYHRAEVVGALLSVLTIWLLAIVFCVLAVNRLWTNEFEINADTMLIIASLGLVVNIVMGAILHGVCHNHSHGLTQHNHENNINVRAAAAHVLGDLIQSLGVLIAAIVIKLCPNAKIVDPICTLIFSIIVFATTGKVGKDSLMYLLEASPINSVNLTNELNSLTSVKHVHSLHIWSLAPGKNAVAVHLAIDQFCDRDLVLKKATSIIKRQISYVSCTIQVEIYNSDLVNSCKSCQSITC